MNKEIVEFLREICTGWLGWMRRKRKRKRKRLRGIESLPQVVRRLGFDLDRVLPSPLVLDFGGCRSQNDNRIGERARENASGSCVFSVFVCFAATLVFRPFFFFFFFSLVIETVRLNPRR